MTTTTQSRALSPGLGADTTAPGTVHGLVARHAVATPDAIAVIHGSRRVTYRELDTRAAGYAAWLAGLGLRQGDFLPVALPRSLRLVGVILGALRLGAAYSLLDLSWPGERINNIVRPLRARLLVTEAPIGGLPVPSSSPPGWDACGKGALAAVGGPAGSESSPGHAVVRPQDPCSVFFTSGSTGRPKGAISPHSGTARLVDEGTFAPFGPQTVMAQAGAQPWDAFNLEMWAPLMTGGTTVLVDEPYLGGPLVRELVAAHGLNTAWFTTSVFNMLVDEDPGCFAGLATALIGGERLSPPHVRAFLRRHPAVTLINGFGPVETTVFCSTRRIAPADCDQPGGIPVGVPVPRTAMFVLDGERPCADGEVGELCVAGDGLAIGYLCDKELTRRKFPTLLLDGRPQRVYRTGDLALRDQAGVFHFRGRADRQVKIRGHRVEPAEAETVISGLSGVGRCVVLPRRGPGGECTGLDACVTATAGVTLDTAELLRAARAALAPYQVPDRLVCVPAIPLTLTGKLDEAALRAVAGLAAAGEVLPGARHTQAGDVPDSRLRALGDDLADGRQRARAGTLADDRHDRLETTVRRAFASVLGIAEGRLASGATIIELGGSSLDVGRIAARLGDALGRTVPLSQVFRTPTVAGLAAALSGLPPDAQPAAALAATALSSMQTAMLVQHVISPDDRGLHCVLGWRIEGRPDRAALRAAIACVHARHPYLNSVYELAASALAYPRQAPCPDLTELITDTEADARQALDRELARPYRLERGLVWRPVYVAVRRAHVTLLGIGVHHIAFDGTSAGIIAAEMSAAYNALRAGQEPRLPPAPSQADIAAARAAQARGADLPRQREYWKVALAGLQAIRYPGGAESPGWRPSGTVERELPAELAAAVRELAARQGVSPFAVYLSAYGQALSTLTGQRDLSVATPVSQRGATVLASAISYLVNIVCLRLQTGADASPAAAIAQAAARVSAALAAQDVPFDEVSTLAGRGQADQRLPELQNLFALQDQGAGTLELHGVRSESFRPRYPDIPGQVFTEIWPRSDGSAQLTITYQPAHVSGAFCEQLAARYLARLQAYRAAQKALAPGKRMSDDR